jgi:hypothetical protein
MHSSIDSVRVITAPAKEPVVPTTEKPSGEQPRTSVCINFGQFARCDIFPNHLIFHPLSSSAEGVPIMIRRGPRHPGGRDPHETRRLASDLCGDRWREVHDWFEVEELLRPPAAQAAPSRDSQPIKLSLHGFALLAAAIIIASVALLAWRG